MATRRDQSNVRKQRMAEYHLTPRGWEEGSSKTDFGSDEKAVPHDRVLTVREMETLSSSFSKMDRGRSVVWKSEEADKIKALTEQFGEWPS